MDAQLIAQAVKEAIESVREDNGEIKVGVSQRHVHLSREDLDILFGKGYELTKKKVLMGREFASNEVVTLVGPSLKVIENVRVLGPVRKNTIANRHIHLTPEFAQKHGIKDNDYVDVEIDSEKPTKFFGVQVRVRDDFNVEMHIDTDDANSCALKNGMRVKIINK